MFFLSKNLKFKSKTLTYRVFRCHWVLITDAVWSCIEPNRFFQRIPFLIQFIPLFSLFHHGFIAWHWWWVHHCLIPRLSLSPGLFHVTGCQMEFNLCILFFYTSFMILFQRLWDSSRQLSVMELSLPATLFPHSCSQITQFLCLHTNSTVVFLIPWIWYLHGHPQSLKGCF